MGEWEVGLAGEGQVWVGGYMGQTRGGFGEMGWERGPLGMGVLAIAPNPLFIDEGTGIVALQPGGFSRERVRRRGLPGMD